MKRLILLLTIIYPFGLFAQEASSYRPFVEEGKVWYTRGKGLGVVDGIQKYAYQRHFIQGDTIVAGKKCKKLFQQDIAAFFLPGADSLMAIYMYEEDRKVKFFYEGDSEPRLFFDFGAEIGDTLVVWEPDAHRFDALMKSGGEDLEGTFHRIFTDTLIIDKIAYEEEGGRVQRKTWYRVKGYDTHLNAYLMEGVGAKIHPFFNTNLSNGPSQYLFVACIVGDEVLYLSELYSQTVDIPLPTSITAPHFDSTISSWHTLSGHQLSSPPTRKGVYIRDGRKVLMK